jgi:hypothetical protein
MSEACYTARATLRQQVRELIEQIPLQRNESGQYQHDDIIVFLSGVERIFKGLYNPLQPGKGMADLLVDTTNALNKIKSTDMADAATIIKESKDTAAQLSKSTGMQEKPTLVSRADAQDEADRRNYAYQAAIGTKEGAAEAITAKVGSDVTDAVLRNIDGNDNKGVDEWTLAEVIEAAKQGAIRPTTIDILLQVIAAFQFQFDFRKKVATNMEQLRAKVNRVISYGITHDDTAVALTLLANIERAAANDWGRELRPALQEIRRTYKYNHKHDATSIAHMLKELAAADAVRNLNDAPAPTTESANAVADSVSLLTQMLQANQEYEESAFAAQSDSDSSSGGRRSKSKSNRNTRGGRGRSRSRDSRGNSSKQSINKDCPHCTEYKRRKKHPNVPNEQCFWNKKYKGFRPKWICDEMDVKYAGRHKFSSDMGGYPSDSDDE